MGECVKVVVRCRPMNEREVKLQCLNVIDINHASRECSIQLDDTNPAKRFTFDGAYDAHCNTEQIYAHMIYPLVEVSGDFNDKTH